MKRIGNLYSQIISMDNLIQADQKARKGKSRKAEIAAYDQNREQNLKDLQKALIEKTYRTSEYKTFTISEPKERLVYQLPYYPDRIAHHAIMNVLEKVFTDRFTADTYSSIKGRGIHLASKKVRQALKDSTGTQYCLKMDIRKFYPSINHTVLKTLLRKKIKDKDLLWLLDEIVDSAPGLPIGNYISQYLANYYLTYFDIWVKQDLRVKHYFRYADDMIILGQTASELHQIRAKVQHYLITELHLELKSNYQVFKVNARGIDFVGYVHYHTHTRLRKSIKQSFARAVNKGLSRQSLASFMGWAKHADCRNLLKKLLKCAINQNKVLSLQT